MNYISNSYLELSKDILLYHPKSIIIDVKKDNLSIGFSTSNEMPFHEYQLRFDKTEAKKIFELIFKKSDYVLSNDLKKDLLTLKNDWKLLVNWKELNRTIWFIDKTIIERLVETQPEINSYASYYVVIFSEKNVLEFLRIKNRLCSSWLFWFILVNEIYQKQLEIIHLCYIHFHMGYKFW